MENQRPVAVKLEVEFTDVDNATVVFGNAAIVQAQQGYIILNFGQAAPLIPGLAANLIDGTYEAKLSVKPFVRIAMPREAVQSLFDQLKNVLSSTEGVQPKEGADGSSSGM